MCQTGPVAKTIQVRNVPERLHRELRKRARAQRQTLTDYVEQLLERELSRSPAEYADEAYERKVFSTPGVTEALDEALQEIDALKRPPR